MKYSPGRCNIGRTEMEKRYIAGFVGLVLSAIIIGMVSAYILLWKIPFNSINRAWIYILVLPLFLSYEGFFQAYFKFCSTFGMLGIYDMSNGRRLKRKRVKNRSFYLADVRRSLFIHALSLFFSVATVTVIYLLYANFA